MSREIMRNGGIASIDLVESPFYGGVAGFTAGGGEMGFGGGVAQSPLHGGGPGVGVKGDGGGFNMGVVGMRGGRGRGHSGLENNFAGYPYR